MFDWLFSKPVCPVDLPTRDWIEQRWNWLTEQFGPERVRAAHVILPMPEFFPDAYSGTPDCARVMLDRVCGYMGIAPDVVDVSFYQDCNPVYDEKGRRGTAGWYREEGGRFRIWLEIRDLDDPLALVATIAHELGHIHLLGHGRVSPGTEDHEPLTDLLTVYLGLGIFAANSVIREHFWHAGTVAGWSMRRWGYLSIPMFGYALARFARARDEDTPLWTKHLSPGVRSEFDKARRFLVEADDPNFAPGYVAPFPQRKPDSQETDPAPDSAVTDRASLSAKELLRRYACGERDFRNAHLRGRRLSKADLSGSVLAAADLSGANLIDAILAKTDLCEADLQEADLRGAVLRDANLRDADLSGANLAGADLTGADIRGADFRGGTLDRSVLIGTLRNRSTDFSGVNLSNVECEDDLSQEDLRGLMLTDQVAATCERTRWCVAIFMVAFLGLLVGAMIGGVVGMVLRAVLGENSLADFSVAGGAVLFSVFAVWRVIRSRARTAAD